MLEAAGATGAAGGGGGGLFGTASGSASSAADAALDDVEFGLDRLLDGVERYIGLTGAERDRERLTASNQATDDRLGFYRKDPAVREAAQKRREAEQKLREAQKRERELIAKARERATKQAEKDAARSRP
ncbi:hypothetical protein [Subtercola endophyticus]|uniref:hypothetical protein n=1 Tax=Subtercola endophyticus TaxID=2895559 RepID=UPI001E2962D4|nr:hypothetical protein [Subtercola endophyticus]UFS58975.1 hypothetical protein LQ955_18600 [Subtercola endophyticus]